MTRPDAETAGEVHGAEAPAADGRSRPSVGAVAPWIVAIAAAAVAVVALVQWWQVDRRVRADEQARDVAGQVVVALTNWEAAELDAVREVLDRHGTARFREEAAQLLDQFAQGLQEADARSDGEVLDLVASAPEGTDAAVALAVIRQDVTSATLDEPDVQCWGTRVLLQHRDGRWLVDGVELYGPNRCPTRPPAPEGDP